MELEILLVVFIEQRNPARANLIRKPAYSSFRTSDLFCDFFVGVILKLKVKNLTLLITEARQ